MFLLNDHISIAYFFMFFYASYQSNAVQCDSPQNAEKKTDGKPGARTSDKICGCGLTKNRPLYVIQSHFRLFEYLVPLCSLRDILYIFFIHITSFVVVAISLSFLLISFSCDGSHIVLGIRSISKGTLPKFSDTD